MKYRLDYTIRMDGLEYSSSHYCPDLPTLNKAMRKLEETRGAWGFQVHETSDAEQQRNWQRLTEGCR